MVNMLLLQLLDARLPLSYDIRWYAFNRLLHYGNTIKILQYLVNTWINSIFISCIIIDIGWKYLGNND